MGQNFSPQPADNRVTFEGAPATVVSASANRLVVKPNRPVAQARWVAVSVEVAQRTSNAMQFELVPSGTPRVEQHPLITSPSAVVRVGADLYVTSQGFANISGGLFRVEPDGRTTRVVRPRFILQRETAQSRYDTLSEQAASVRNRFSLVLANPPYLVDPAQRAYRHGGGPLGAGLSLAILDAALERLAPGGTLVLYTGAAIEQGTDPFRAAAAERLRGCGARWTYREMDPDVFGEELDAEAYRHTDRIAAVVLTVEQDG